METCRIGARFPEITFPSVDGKSLTIPDALAGNSAVVLLYRGHW